MEITIVLNIYEIIIFWILCLLIFALYGHREYKKGVNTINQGVLYNKNK